MRIFNRKRFEREMDDELRFHMEAYAEDLVRKGLSRSNAERLARVEFGAVEVAKDDCRQAWGWQVLDELRADVRLTLRSLRQNPGFAAVAILSLSLGIGANSALFGLVDAVLLRKLPVRAPDRLVFIENGGTDGLSGGPPYPCFELFRREARSFESMAAYSPSTMELSIDGQREQLRGVWVSGNLYEMLGVRPLIGRTLSDVDDRTTAEGGAVVISRRYWQQRFGGDPRVVGRTVGIFEHTVTIVGVMPSEIMSPEPGRPIDIAAPMILSDPASLHDRGAWWIYIVARLKPGIRAEQAQAEANVLFQAYMADVHLPGDFRHRFFEHIELPSAAQGDDQLRKRFGKPLIALMILAALVLIAACVNLANLMLARAATRRREFALRLAIGAGRWRLIRQTLTEALVLVTAGALAGLVFARYGEAALASFFAEGSDQVVLNLLMSGRMLLFALAAALLTGIAFGLLPALNAARTDPAVGLQGGGRSVAGSRGGLRTGRSLVLVQVALSMVLLAGAGLFLRSLRRLDSVDLGFAREGVLTMEVTPERQWYGTPHWLTAQNEVLERVQRIPGVRSAGWSWTAPLSGRDRGTLVDVPGFTPRSETELSIHFNPVSPEYFDTIGMSLSAGRGFTHSDDRNAPLAAVLNETAARFYFGGANPLGRKLQVRTEPGKPVYEIVGLVKDIRHASVRGQQNWRFLFVPIAQSMDHTNRLTLSVRCLRNSAAFAEPVRKELRGVDSSLLINNVSTIEDRVRLSLMRERLVSALSAAFGAVTLLLACIGLYGILAYGVARRTNELGIRMALGATGNSMMWLVLREALALAAGGVILGLPAVIGLERLSRSLLYGVDTVDIVALCLAALLLLAFAAAAALIPARRAGSLDPAGALRVG